MIGNLQHIAKVALFSSMVFVPSIAQAAPLQQAECITDALEAPQFKAILRSFFAKKLDQDKQAELARKAIAPTVKRCSAKFGWSDLDIENAYIHTETHAVERVMFAVLEAYKINSVTVNRVYKDEPLSRVEMIIALDDKEYVDSLMNRFADAGIKTKDKNIGSITLTYVMVRLMADQALNDFYNGQKFGAEIEAWKNSTEPEAEQGDSEAKVTQLI
jgi:hypothetical protein